LYTYTFLTGTFEITVVKLVIAILLITFAIIELSPIFNALKFEKKHMSLGGALSGFFGGLSGHQGALRSAFLINSGLTKETFIGTTVVISSVVDFSRLSVYATRFFESGLNENKLLILCATLSAIIGAIIGNQLLKKITLKFIQKLIAFLLILISLALGFGIV
jgi:uncharacterized membrane protein YfcA